MMTESLPAQKDIRHVEAAREEHPPPPKTLKWFPRDVIRSDRWKL